MTDFTKGTLSAIVSSASFGLIPLFTVPVLAAGMDIPNTLLYRYCIGCMAMLVVLAFQRENMHLRFGDAMRIAMLALIYVISSISLFMGYRYMPSGIATTLLFSYPVWTEILMMVFYHERLTPHVAVAIALAVGGVFLLSGFGQAGAIKSVVGIGWEMLSGLSYAAYMVLFPHMRVHNLPSLKVTFYVFFFGMLFLLAYVLFTEGGLQPITSGDMCLNLVLLGLLPTALSNVYIIKALKLISSTMVAVFGAFEPLTAMTIGILCMGEPLTVPVVAGFVLIIAAVMTLVLRRQKT